MVISKNFWNAFEWFLQSRHMQTRSDTYMEIDNFLSGTVHGTFARQWDKRTLIFSKFDYSQESTGCTCFLIFTYLAVLVPACFKKSVFSPLLRRNFPRILSGRDRWERWTRKLARLKSQTKKGLSLTETFLHCAYTRCFWWLSCQNVCLILLLSINQVRQEVLYFREGLQNVENLLFSQIT